jgi:hypothetical protein
VQKAKGGPEVGDDERNEIECDVKEISKQIGVLLKNCEKAANSRDWNYDGKVDRSSRKCLRVMMTAAEVVCDRKWAESKGEKCDMKASKSGR